MVTLKAFFAVVIAWRAVSGQQECSGADSCRDCISRSVNCAWCSAPGIMSERCMGVADMAEECPEEFVENPRAGESFLQPMQSPLEQFTPSRATISLRVGERRTLPVAVSPTANYPLDLYFLMDLSFSMGPFIDQLFNLSQTIANTLGNITEDYRVGFGVFNEKPVVPFIRISSLRSLLSVPWAENSFRHYLSLTDNTSALGVVTENLTLVTNQDDPEALLDGLLQCVVCTSLIGWRQEARKLVVVFTDQLYHVAGDGLLAGLSMPSDGECHTEKIRPEDQFSDYVRTGNQDYPSIGLVRRRLEEKDIIPVFATFSDLESSYRYLIRQLPGSIFQSIGSKSSSESVSHELFLQIIRDSFQVTSQRVEILPLVDMADFDVIVNATCPRDGQKMGSGCDNVEIGERVEFNVTVVLSRCPTSTHNTISLRIPGFGAIPINVTSICSCLCDDNREENSTECSKSGDLSCGTCECHDNRFGSRCQCTSLEAAALPCSEELSQPCSGRGTCECGMCICSNPLPANVPVEIENATYYGDDCECDNFNCPRGLEGLVCSDRGLCDCGYCQCLESDLTGMTYRGISCELRPAVEVCTGNSSNNTALCSGRGSCSGEKCVCEEGYEGRFCERITPVLHEADLCSSVEDCVTCNGTEDPVAMTTCDQLNCSVVNIEMAEDNYMIAGSEATMCEVAVDNCLYVFFTVGIEESIHVLPPECEEPLLLPIWAVVVILVGALIFLAILIFILAKCILSCRDYHDYRKWENTKGSVKFGQKQQNPLYMNPTKEYLNVNYRDKTSLQYSSLNETAQTNLSNPTPYNPSEPATPLSLEKVPESNGIPSNRASRNSQVHQTGTTVEIMWNSNALWEES